MHPGRACSTAAGWCCRTSWRRCRRPPGARSCARPTPRRVRRRCSTAGSSRVDGDRLVVRGADPAELNAPLVGAGVRCTSSRPSGRTLRRSCSQRPGAERRPGGGGPVIARRAAQAVPPAAHLGDDRAAQRAADAGRGAAARSPTSAPRPGQGPAFLSAVLANGALFPLAALAIVLPLFLPIAVAVVAGDSIAGEAQAGTLRYLLVRPVGRTRLLVAKLVARHRRSCWSRCVVVAVVGLRRRAAAARRASRRRQAVVSVSGTLAHAGAARRADAAGDRLRRGLDARRRRDRAVPLHAHRLAAGRRAGRAGVPVASSLLLTLDAARALAALPADPLLAGVRRPVPRPDPVARHRARRRRCRRSTSCVLLGAAWANFTTKDITS